MDPQKVVKSSTTFTIGSKTSSPSLAKSWRSSGTPSKTLPETHQSPIKALRSPLWHQQRLWKFTVLLMMSSRTHRKSPCWTFASAKVSAACTTDWRLINWWFVKVSVSSSSELNFMNLWILITLSHFVSFLSFTSLFAYFVCLFSAFFHSLRYWMKIWIFVQTLWLDRTTRSFSNVLLFLLFVFVSSSWSRAERAKGRAHYICVPIQTSVFKTVFSP